MSRVTIIPQTVAGQTATELDIHIISMALYPSTISSVYSFYGFYKAGNLRIEDAAAEGNTTLGNLISADSKTALLNALIAQVGAVTEAKLMIHQPESQTYIISYKQTGGIESTATITGTYFIAAEDTAVKDAVLTVAGASIYVSNITKIGVTTDQHWDGGESYAGRDQALVHLTNFATEMASWGANMLLEGGDKTGDVDRTSAGRLIYMQDVSDKMQAAATACGCPLYKWGWGNHDFEYNTFASVQAKYAGETGLVSGTLYGYWEDANYRYISMDSNYIPSGQSHQSNTHVGYGYINTDQLTWLSATLANSTKMCIVMCHHPLCEIDTEKIFLTKEIYHTQNRVAVRAILEASAKVLFCLHGHMHITAHNVINGIPYLVLADLNIPPATTTHWDLPNTSVSGKWGKIEIDRDLSEIRFIQEVRVSGVVQEIYRFVIPFTPLYTDQVVDATNLYVNDDLFIVTKPCSTYNSDPRLSYKSIKLQCITSTPDFGRPTWTFTPQTGTFEMRLSARLASQTTKFLKVHNTSSATAAVYMGFHANGNFFAFNGATLTNLQTYSLNTWYTLRVVINVGSGTFSVYIDGVLKASGYAFNNANATLQKLEFVTEAGNMYIDDLHLA